MRNLARRSLPEVLPPERIADDLGDCLMRMVGVIESACTVEVIGIESRKVHLRIRLGSTTVERTLHRGETWIGTLHIKTTNVGIHD